MKYKKLIAIMLFIFISTVLSCTFSFGYDGPLGDNNELQIARDRQVENEEYIKTLATLQENNLASETSFISASFRFIGYGGIKILSSILDGLYDGLNKVIDFMSFSYSKEITTLVNKYSFLYQSFFVITLTAFGLYLLMGKNPTNQLNTVNSIIMIGIIILAMPLLTQKLSEFTSASSKYAINSWGTQETNEINSISSSALSSQIYDLTILDKDYINNGKLLKGLPKKGVNNLEGSDYKILNINEELDPDIYKLRNDEMWQYKRVKTYDNYVLQKLHSSFFSDTYYYRYQVKSWLYIYIVLLCAIIAMSLLLIRIARMIVEIAFSNIYMPFIATTDIASGQRIKEGMKGFVSLFASIFFAVALFGVYSAGFIYINKKIDGGILQYLLLIALTWAIIDGSMILERIIGVDIGLKSGWQMAIGVASAGRVAKGTGRLLTAPVRTAGKGLKAGKRVYDSSKNKGNAIKDKMANRLADKKSDEALNKNDTSSAINKDEKNKQNDSSINNKKLDLDGKKQAKDINTSDKKQTLDMSGKKNQSLDMNKGESINLESNSKNKSSELDGNKTNNIDKNINKNNLSSNDKLKTKNKSTISNTKDINTKGKKVK